MTSTTLNFDLFAKDHASSTFSRFGRNVDGSTRSVGFLKSGLGKLATAFVGLAVIQKTTQFLSESVAEGREANKVAAQTEAVLKSTTRGVVLNANISAKGVSDLANALSLKSGIDDEAIQSGENLLLTFKNIRNEVGKGNDIFTRGTKAALDMSVAMKTDLKSANIQVGKALNDPVKGITALTRVGVTFTEKQKKTIESLVKSGDTMKAQKVILRELNSEFKGSAKAQADPADKAKVAWENFKEEIGQKLIPTLDRMLVWFVNDGLPAIKTFASFAADKLGPVIATVADLFSGAGDSSGKLSEGFAKVVQAGKDVWTALQPIVVDIVNKIKENWPQISATIGGVLTQIGSTVSSFVALVTAVWNKWGDEIMLVAGAIFKNVYAQISGALTIIQGVIKVFTGLIKGDWSMVWDGIKQIVSGAWNTIKSVVRNSLGVLKSIVGGLAGDLKGKFTEAWNKARDATIAGLIKVVHWVGTLPTKILRGIGHLGTLLFDAGMDVIKGLVDGIKNGAETLLKGALSEVTDRIPDWKGPLSKDKKLLRPTGQAIMGGLTDGIKDKMADLRETLRGITESVRSSFGTSIFGQGFGDAKSMKTFQRASLNSARTLLTDVRKLIKWGLSDSLISQLVSSGDLTGIHALATSSKGEVRDISRLNQRTERVLGQVGRLAGNELTGSDREALDRQADKIGKAVGKALEGKAFHFTDGHGRNLTAIMRSTAH